MKAKPVPLSAGRSKTAGPPRGRRRPLLGLALCLCAAAALGGCARASHAQGAQQGAAAGAYRLRLLAADVVGGGDGAISPDGDRFVISSKRAGSYDLWVYDIGPGRWTRVTDDPGDEIEAQWSPDGRRLVYTATKVGGNKDLYLLSLEGGAPKQLTDSPDEDEYPNWSPDGRTIVYTTGPWKQRDFYLMPAEGGPARKLTERSGQAGACSFAPDGRSVICHRYDAGQGNVERIPVEGGPAVPVTTGTKWDYKPTLSPDGKWVAFSRTDEGPTSIWLMPAGGGQARPLVTADANDRWPTWAASGDRLFFHRSVEVGTAVKILDRRTGRTRTIVGPEEKPSQASLDPQGRRVVYGAEEGGRRVLRLLDLKTGASRRLDTGAGEANFPRFSPDGRRIAFVSRGADRWEVCVMDADGGGMVDLTKSVRGLKGMRAPLDWSPDGTKLVFKADTEPFEAALFVLDTKGGGVRNVTNDHWFNESPSFAPDGRSVTFMSTRGGDWTWGLFRLSLSDGAVSVVAKPDYTEKNFPRAGAGGWTVWSMYGEDGIEYLAERSPAGRLRLRKEAGARWPSYSADNNLLLFTTVERRVEYWLAENLYSAGSPLLAEPEGAPRASCDAPEPRRETLALGVGLSPVKLHGR